MKKENYLLFINIRWRRKRQIPIQIKADERYHLLTSKGVLNLQSNRCSQLLNSLVIGPRTKEQRKALEALADRRRLLRMAIQSVIELLRLDPQKFHAIYYNQSIIQPENNEEPILVEAERLYGKMLENITNKIVINLNENNSSISFPQKESSEQNSDDMLMPSAFSYTKEECTLSDPEDQVIERDSIKERPDLPAAGHRMKFYPYSGQAWHPNFDAEV